MIKRVGIKNKKVVGFVLMAFFLFFTFNTVFFQHVHRLPNGELVWHSHPFNKTSESIPSGNQHHHTYTELGAISSVAANFIIQHSVGLATFFRLTNFLFEPLLVSIVNCSSTVNIGRSPPSLY